MLRLAGLLSERLGGAQAFFCNSGAEANEAALKVARKATGRPRIVALEGGFHGRTYGALSATGQPGKWEGFGPLVPGFSFARPNDVESLEAAVAPGGELAAILLEPVLGEGGVLPLEEGFVRAAAEIAREVGALLCRRRGTGRARPHRDVLRLRAARHRAGPRDAGEGARQRPADRRAARSGRGRRRDRPGRPRLDVRRQPGRVGGCVRRRGGDRRCAARERRRARSAARGGSREAPGRARGARARACCSPAFSTATRAPVVDECRARGLLVLTAGPDVLRLLPPLVVTEAEVDEALGVLARGARDEERRAAPGDPASRPRSRDLHPGGARRCAPRGGPRRRADDDLARRPRARADEGARAVRPPRLRGAGHGRRRPHPRDRRRDAPLRDARRAGAGPLVVVTTPSGYASALAQAIDEGRHPGIAGTIAGDNTIFLAPREGTTADALSVELGAHLGPAERRVSLFASNGRLMARARVRRT